MLKNPPAMQETWLQSLGWKIPWRRAWQPTQVFLPGEPRGQRSLVGYSPWGLKESDVTEPLSTAEPIFIHCPQTLSAPAQPMAPILPTVK